MPENTVFDFPYLQSLPEKKLKVIFEKTFRVVKDVSELQSAYLSNYNKNDTAKTQRHLFFLTIVKSFWKDTEFAFALGKSKHRSYAVYPARTIMEKALKILWFSNLKAAEQDVIAEKELLWQCLIHYNKGKNPEFSEHYNLLNKRNFPEINDAKLSDFKAFPGYEELCLKSGLVDASDLYLSYRYLSGIPHGDFLSVYMVNNMGMEQGEYRRSILVILRFSIEMIKVVDFHLKNITKNEVSQAIEKAKKLSEGICAS